MIRSFFGRANRNSKGAASEAEENQRSAVPWKPSGKMFQGRGSDQLCQILLIGRGRIENCPNNLIQFIIDSRAPRGFNLVGQGYR